MYTKPDNNTPAGGSAASVSNGALGTDVRGTGTANLTPGSKVDSLHKQEPTLFFRPETGDFLLVPAQDMVAFEAECRRLDMVIALFHDANEDLNRLLDDIRARQPAPIDVSAQSTKERQELEELYKKAKEARKKLYGELKGLGKLDGAHTSITELIPFKQSAGAGEGKPTAWLASKKMTYVRSDKVRSHWRAYALRGDEKKSGNKSFVKKDEQGRTKIDTQELKKGVTELKTKVKSELYKVDEHAIQGVLTAWATEWNKDLSFDWAKSQPDAALSNNVDLTAQAQLMRYLAGVGLATEWDRKKGKCNLKASARAEFAVAEAKAAAAAYFPDKVGWIWSLNGDDGKSYPLGAIRFKAELSLVGMVGASIVAEAGLAIDYKDEKRKDVFGVKGAPIEEKKGGDNPRELKLNGKAIDPSIGAEIEAFAGAKAEAKFNGALQWLNPENMLKDYSDFAKVGPSIAGLAGIGAGGMLELTYVGGKFRFKAMASVCLGVGAKGKLELEVDALLIGEFMKWFFYQLYHANFNQLTFVKEEAFQVITRMQVMLVDGSVAGYRSLEDFIGKGQEAIERDFVTLLSELEREERRVQLMQRILSSSDILKYATPEAKGAMLYQLTRHDWRTDGLDGRNHGIGYYAQRKRAIKTLLRFAHTKRDFDNIIQHMSDDGSKTDFAASKSHVMAFLNMAVIGNANDDEEMKNFYNHLRVSLKDVPSLGYPVYPNDTTQYAMQRDQRPNHPMFAHIQQIDLPNWT